MPVDMSLDHLRTVGHNHHNFRVEIFKFLIIPAQLRYMVGAMSSDKSKIEYQEHVLLTNHL